MRNQRAENRCTNDPRNAFARRAVFCAAGVTAIGAAPSLAQAEEWLQFGANYTGDVVSSWSDSVNGRAHYLDSTSVTLDADLSQKLGRWAPVIHADVNVTSGASANDDIGTLQGVDNIEVGRQRTRIYELWAEETFFSQKLSLRAGFQELNSEFQATDSSGLLMNSSFGLTPELSATGSNGPSTYPSTAPGLRLLAAVNESVDVLAAAFNADALGIGDPGGPDLAFNDGALVISQVNWRGPAAFSLGAWTYTQPQSDVHDLDADGAPARRDAKGLYATVEKAIFKSGETGATAFARGGVSDGRTTDFSGSVQAGVLFERPVASRPDSAASIGVATAFTSDGFQNNARDAGVNPADAETTFELTYSDKVTSWLTLQPDLQFTLNPGGDESVDSGVTFGVRISIQPWST